MKQHPGRMAAVKRQFDRFIRAYSEFMEKQGFYLVLGICVLVIVGTAVWTKAVRTPETPPQRAEGKLADAPYEGVQNLADVTIPAAASTPASPEATPAPSFSRPVEGTLLRRYDRETPVFFSSANLWQVHAACDYRAAAGDVVKAIADGTVTGITDGGTYGKTVTIDCGGGFAATYGGLSVNSYVKIGDPVRKAQAIGHVGNTTLLETEDGPHLHFSLTRNGQPVDPELFFLEKK